MNSKFRQKIKNALRHQIRHTRRMGQHSFETLFLIMGAGIVSFTIYLFSKLILLVLFYNDLIYKTNPLIFLILLPFGLTFISWVTRRYAPNIIGGGIPQVIAAMHLPNGRYKSQLVRFRDAFLKIILTSSGVLLGASLGREGPAVQIGAAIMLAWGKLCRKYHLAFHGLNDNTLLAIGGAGGVAAAFNAPLSGVVFAIEELGRGKAIRWDRQILVGVAASGLFLVLIQGNNPFFPHIKHANDIIANKFYWVLLCGVICGIAGGTFAKLIGKGLPHFLPKHCRDLASKHPLWVTFLCGLLIAIIGLLYNGATLASGYQLVRDSVHGDNYVQYGSLPLGKWAVTILSQWAQVPGGIFTPSLSIGAAIGETIAHSFNYLMATDFMILLCMSAFLAAATQSPLTATVIVVEMTGSIETLFWCILCSIIASIVSRQISPKPFYLSGAHRNIKKIKELEKKDLHDMADKVESMQAKGKDQMFR